MTTRFSGLVRSSDRLGFSLVELLVVMAIIALLVSFAIPAIVPLLRSSSLTAAANTLTEQFDFARQTALTQDKNVEVRLYDIGSKSAPSDLQFRALRVYYANATTPAQAQAVGKFIYFPEPVIISSDITQSTILDYTNTSRSGLTYAQETSPVYGTINYVSFLFRPDGSTNLLPTDPPLGNWFLTLYLEGSPINSSTHLPNNYFTAQIDPVTGHVRSYRP